MNNPKYKQSGTKNIFIETIDHKHITVNIIEYRNKNNPLNYIENAKIIITAKNGVVEECYEGKLFTLNTDRMIFEIIIKNEHVTKKFMYRILNMKQEENEN